MGDVLIILEHNLTNNVKKQQNCEFDEIYDNKAQSITVWSYCHQKENLSEDFSKFSKLFDSRQ